MVLLSMLITANPGFWTRQLESLMLPGYRVEWGHSEISAGIHPAIWEA